MVLIQRHHSQAQVEPLLGKLQQSLVIVSPVTEPGNMEEVEAEVEVEAETEN